MEIIGNNTKKEATRIETFSDGVFAIAITLLIIEVKIPTDTELKHGLLNALLQKWPGYLAFFIGFFTVLVSWINHHYLFNRIYAGNHALVLANSYTLFLISFVPYPTAVLAQSFHNGDLQTAVQLFGITYFLMSSSFRLLSSFVNNDPTVIYSGYERRSRKAMNRMYDLALIHTAVTFAISFYSVPISLLLYVVLFSMFLFPAWYVEEILKFGKKTNKDEVAIISNNLKYESESKR